MFGDNVKLATIIGCTMCMLLSMANGVLAVLTRMMQSLSVSVMMTYIALISIVIVIVVLLIEIAITGDPLRITHYNGEQVMYGLLAGMLNILSLVFKIIAYQNERSGFITMLAYIGLVYAFLGDYFIFDEHFSLLAFLGLALILGLNIALVLKNAKKQ